jgi:hypothetical protein
MKVKIRELKEVIEIAMRNFNRKSRLGGTRFDVPQGSLELLVEAAKELIKLREQNPDELPPENTVYDLKRYSPSTKITEEETSMRNTGTVNVESFMREHGEGEFVEFDKVVELVAINRTGAKRFFTKLFNQQIDDLHREIRTLKSVIEDFKLVGARKVEKMFNIPTSGSTYKPLHETFAEKLDTITFAFDPMAYFSRKEVLELAEKCDLEFRYALATAKLCPVPPPPEVPDATANPMTATEILERRAKAHAEQKPSKAGDDMADILMKQFTLSPRVIAAISIFSAMMNAAANEPVKVTSGYQDFLAMSEHNTRRAFQLADEILAYDKKGI